MSDEEKEAIEWLKRLVKLNKRDNLDDTFAEILLNLIEKQQKEIEELEKINTDLLLKLEMKKLLFVRKDKTTNKLLSELYIRQDELEKDYISKDKIKAKIEYNKVFNDDIHKYTVLTLEELLEKE